MAYSKAQRSAAAKRGWQTRKKQTPDYDRGSTSIRETVSGGDRIELGGELPTSRLFEAGGIADWPDPVYDIDPDGYRVIHNCAPVIETVDKRGIRIAKLNWGVIGNGARADAYREIIEQAKSWTDMIKWLNWADVDGARFMQIKSSQAREGSTEPWVVPDFWMGGRKKFKAGGDIQWNGRSLVRVRRATGVATAQPAYLPQWQFIIHRPGAGSNPEGDSSIGIAVYRIAHAWEEALKNTEAYMELFGIPIRVFKARFGKIRPDQVTGVMNSVADRLKLMKENKQGVLADEEIIDLIEPKGQGFKDMIEYAKYLEGLLDQLFLSNVLTSKVDDAGRTGDTSVHLSEEGESIYAGAMQIAETLNRCLIPWIERKNPDLPELADGEFEPYIWPEPPEEDNEEDDQSITVESPDGEPTSATEEVVPPGEDTEPKPEPETEPDMATSVSMSTESSSSSSSDEAIAHDALSSGKLSGVALNGAQITSVQGMVQAVADGKLPYESAFEIIAQGFPTIPRDAIDRMLAPARDKTPDPVEPMATPDVATPGSELIEDEEEEDE